MVRLPVSAAVSGHQQCAPRADRQAFLFVRERNGKQMSVGRRLLRLPGNAAIGGRDDGAKRADRPPVQGVVRCEGYAEQVVARAGLSLNPFPAAVRSCEDHSARARDNRPFRVPYIQTVKRRIRGGVLLLPLKAAVVSPQYRPIRANRPPVALVSGKADGVDGIALRQWVLPFPGPRLVLRKYSYRSKSYE